MIERRSIAGEECEVLVKMQFPKLFEPLTIGKLRLKNRIAMAPMGIDKMTDLNGIPAQRAVEYYLERAQSGVGLIITSYFKVENQIDAMKQEGIPIVSKAAMAPLGELCQAAHSLGTKIFIQLTAGFGRVTAPGSLRNAPVSASTVPYYWDPGIRCRPLETDEVKKLVKKFGDAAELVATAGVDGIELHGHEGYLFDQFTSALWNQRTDRYGGDLEGRLTFPLEVLEEIKTRLGKNFVTEYRFGLKHFMKRPDTGALYGENYDEAGRDIDEGLKMAELLEAAGFDALHVDAGCYESWYLAHPPNYLEHGCLLDMSARTKKVVHIPVIAVGRLEMPEVAEKAIEEGKADVVALGRGLLADPQWPLKVREGRTEEIRYCIGCHDGCIGRAVSGQPLSCALNPSCGRERAYRLTPAERPKSVAVIGGGLAGMEAARVAALRGHKVTLYEKKKSLGGHLVEASVPDFKQDLRRLLHWYENQIEKSEMNVFLDTEVSLAVLEEEKPEVILVATGSEPFIPDIPGIKIEHVVTCIDLLSGRCEPGNTVVFVGGGLVGCETALWLARQGKRVTIVEKLSQLMMGGLTVPLMNRLMLLNLLEASRIKIITEAEVQEITESGLILLRNDSIREEVEADTVVVSVGMRADDALYTALEGKASNLYALGDCREPRNVMSAIWDGFEVSRAV